jgi:hypothetical protein
MSVVTLDVGGTKFRVAKETLSGVEWFAHALRGLGTENDEIFVDRDPQRFGVVLNYLRTNRLSLGRLPLADILEEASFFGLKQLETARIEYLAVTSWVCSTAGQQQFTVQGAITCSKSTRLEMTGEFEDCQKCINKLIVNGWTVDTVTTWISNPFHWILSRVVVGN